MGEAASSQARAERAKVHRMGGKAKFKKHTAKELQTKLDSQRNVGGGKAGTATRMVARLNFTCQVCMVSVPRVVG